MRNDFAVFILTNGRADDMFTLDALRKGNYTGKWYMVIDNEDETAPRYYEKYGEDHVIMFDKPEIAKRIDTVDTTGNRKAIIFARHACFDIAKKLGLKYFLELDDDFLHFEYRYDQDGVLKHIYCKQLDRLFEDMIQFLEDTGASTVALAQGGDFIGGTNSRVWKKQLARKAMNSFFCRTDEPLEFVGTQNEDVTMYTTYGMRGKLCFTVAGANIEQIQSQTVKGGMTEVYKAMGTYLKSFYSIVVQPSCVKIALMGNKNMRLHHNVAWNNCTPMILNEKWRKTN